MNSKTTTLSKLKEIDRYTRNYSHISLMVSFAFMYFLLFMTISFYFKNNIITIVSFTQFFSCAIAYFLLRKIYKLDFIALWKYELILFCFYFPIFAFFIELIFLFIYFIIKTPYN